MTEFTQPDIEKRIKSLKKERADVVEVIMENYRLLEQIDDDLDMMEISLAYKENMELRWNNNG